MTELHDELPRTWKNEVTKHIRSGDVPGAVALVCHRGKTEVHTVGVQSLDDTHPMKRDTIFRIASMSKPIAAAAAMILVDRGKLALDGPVDALLPELANPRVLKQLDGPIDDTVPAHRAITLRDLLTLRMGLGYIMARSDGYPIQNAINEIGALQGFPKPQVWPEPNTWMAQVGTLPLMQQPGEAWMYDIGIDILGVLIARAADQPLPEFLHHELFDPLGMVDTGFFVPDDQRHRLATAYSTAPDDTGLAVHDAPTTSQWASPPPFPAAASGLVSTCDDYLAFCRLLLDKGRYGEARLLSESSVTGMTQNHLSDAQRAANRIFFGQHSGWGFGMSVVVERGPDPIRPGRFGWNGGLGTTAHTDPSENLIGILLTQRLMDSPKPPAIFTDFWKTVYQNIG